MARLQRRLARNVEGDYYVDDSCIDCGTCWKVAPSVFAESEDELSYVHHQPDSTAEDLRAAMALVACPTASIGTVRKRDVSDAARMFPDPIEDEVYYCGYAAASSYGAASYLVRRPEGNLLVDSPRASGPLLERIEQLGGVATMFLTHRDDVADHEAFGRRFGCERVIHERDLTRDTAGVERALSGDEPIELAEGLLAIPVPGHTAGSCALLYRERFLFSGDHLWCREGGELGASRSVCWYSWSEQVRSLQKLLAFSWQWLLPGHGDWGKMEREAMRRSLERLVARISG